jgi:hypothetical protein
VCGYTGAELDGSNVRVPELSVTLLLEAAITPFKNGIGAANKAEERNNVMSINDAAFVIAAQLRRNWSALINNHGILPPNPHSGIS